jgi:hypothetical protein
MSWRKEMRRAKRRKEGCVSTGYNTDSNKIGERIKEKKLTMY